MDSDIIDPDADADSDIIDSLSAFEPRIYELTCGLLPLPLLSSTTRMDIERAFVRLGTPVNVQTEFSCILASRRKNIPNSFDATQNLVDSLEVAGHLCNMKPPRKVEPVEPEQKFEFFPRLPPEVRAMIWKEAFKAEAPRLIHLRGRNLGAPLHKRRGCPGDDELDGHKILVGGVECLQAPRFLSISREARKFALGVYSIVFRVRHFRNVPERELMHEEVVMMRPQDILVSWYAEEFDWRSESVGLEFTSGASSVRNVLVQPWAQWTDRDQPRFSECYFYLATMIVGKLGNKRALEKLYMLYKQHHIEKPIRYGSEWQRRYVGDAKMIYRESRHHRPPNCRPIYALTDEDKAVLLRIVAYVDHFFMLVALARRG
ncbi:hypothetical protein GGR50DRAFT_218636 [Xylaria sp. CBS 124048]|nr:hypothetical protein GGR50DRAFT_218636 [Xylaria sp. CBS 124048]